jgi:hypothetical protein
MVMPSSGIPMGSVQKQNFSSVAMLGTLPPPSEAPAARIGNKQLQQISVTNLPDHNSASEHNGSTLFVVVSAAITPEINSHKNPKAMIVVRCNRFMI